MSGSVAADDPDEFALPRQVLSLLAGFGMPWWVAGGWAVDLFIGRLTRPHKDIEIAVFRHDQLVLQEHLAGWSLRKVVDHRRVSWLPGELLNRAGARDPWPRARTTTPTSIGRRRCSIWTAALGLVRLSGVTFPAIAGSVTCDQSPLDLSRRLTEQTMSCWQLSYITIAGVE